MRRTAVVIGGGWAGLTAAHVLAARGISVRVFERRAILGGRASSFRAREGGHAVDNGQHLLMGCYGATLAFLDRIGAADRVEIQPRMAVPFFHPDRGEAVFRCAGAPSPLHLTFGVLGYTHLTPTERLRLVTGGLAIAARYRGGSSATVAEALARSGQGKNLRTCFWDPLSIAVLNELPERASADLFAEVLRRVFFARAFASRLVFPRVGLSDLLPSPAAASIESLGGAVETGPAVRGIEIESGRARRVLFGSRPAVDADVIVAAVPPPALADLLPEGLRTAAAFAGLARIHAAPIVSVHLWYRESFGSPRMAGFLDGPIHWLFTPPMQPATGRYLTLVVSGAHDLVVERPDAITTVARRELARYLPATGALEPVDALVVKEPSATFAATPAEQPHRLGTETPIANFFLAGDWTDTKLPATLESAVVSGERAAAAAARYLSTLP